MNREKKELGCIDCRHNYYGVGFVKSRKSESKVMSMSKELLDSAIENGVKLCEIIVDDGGSTDIDRTVIDELLSWLEKYEISALFVRSIFDITRDMDDLICFMNRAKHMDIAIYSLEFGTMVIYEPNTDEGC